MLLFLTEQTVHRTCCGQHALVATNQWHPCPTSGHLVTVADQSGPPPSLRGLQMNPTLERCFVAEEDPEIPAATRRNFGKINLYFHCLRLKKIIHLIQKISINYKINK